MKKLISCIAIAMLLSQGAFAQLQAEAGFGITRNNQALASTAIGYDIPDVPLTLGVRFEGESLFRPYGYYSAYGTGRSVGLFARLYTGKGKFRAGVEADAMVSTYGSYAYGYSGGFTGRSFTLTPSIAWWFSSCFGLRLDAFRIGYVSGMEIQDLRYPACEPSPVIASGGGFDADFRTVSLNLVFRFGI